MKKKFKVYLCTVVILIFVIVNVGCTQKGNSNYINVRAFTASEDRINVAMNVTGVLVPAQTINIGTRISGTVKNVNADVGSSVKAGDTLITLETREINAQLEQAEATVAVNQANLDKLIAGTRPEVIASQQAIVDGEKTTYDIAQKNYDRQNQLLQQDATTQVNAEQAEQALASAKAKYESDMQSLTSMQNGSTKSELNAVEATINQAKASVDYYNAQIENSIINSPISGIITNRNINPGEVVYASSAAGSTQLLTIADTSNLILKGTVAQEMVRMLQEDQEVSVYIDIYPSDKFEGKITKLGPISVDTGEYFPIEISMQNTGDIKAGLSAHASIDIMTNENITVPISAVVEDNGQSYVFVIESGKAYKRIVTTGLRNDKEIIIEKGLEAGEQVAITNTNGLIDGINVNIN